MQSNPSSLINVKTASRLPQIAWWGIILLSALWMALSPPPVAAADPAQPLSRADRVAIQAVINLQLKALAADDDTAAFALAAPDVRRQFGTAEAFMDMVRKGYPPLFRNQSTAFLEAAIIDDDVIQPLRITNRDGTVVIALFSMERQTNGDWRVYGCQLAPSDLQAA
ncbi:MAG: DUF4864 domain-containing protein [Burkholderiales bacterium]|nr:DUF4864 domain-containing protein [Burkholderiales bacterium]